MHTSITIKDKTMKPKEVKLWYTLAGIFLIVIWIIFWIMPTDIGSKIQTRSIIGFFALILGTIITLVRQKQTKK